MSTKASAVAVERRRKPDHVRQEALAAGRRLLVEGGPRAITLKAVAGELGMTHANLIHHFGSAEAFQTQLKDLMVTDLTREITAVIVGEGRARDAGSTVARVFDAYGRQGIAVLMAWSAVTGTPYDEQGLTATTRELVEALAPQIVGPDAVERAREIVALVTLLAFADGLIGPAMAETVGAPRDGVRSLTAQLVAALMSRAELRTGGHRED